MTSSNILRIRKDVRYTSAIDPTMSDGLFIGELWQNTTSGEIFTAIEGIVGFLGWRGTQGTYIPSLIPIASPTHPDLVAMWTMDNISGSTLIDESPNGNNGLIVGATTVPGHIGDAFSFDGINDFLNLSSTPLLPTTGDWAVVAWVKLPSLAADAVVFGQYKNTTSSQRTLLRYDASPQGNFEVWSAGSARVASSAIITAGVYCMVVFQRNGEFLEISVDAETIISSGYSSAILIDNTGNASGGFNTGASGDYNNLVTYQDFDVDHMRVYGRRLIQAEIIQLYNAGAGA